MRLEKLFKVLVVGGITLASGAVACSDGGGDEGSKPSNLGQGGLASTGGATSTGGSTTGTGSSAGQSAVAEAGTDDATTNDAAADATSDGVDSWLSWFS